MLKSYSMSEFLFISLDLISLIKEMSNDSNKDIIKLLYECVIEYDMTHFTVVQLPRRKVKIIYYLRLFCLYSNVVLCLGYFESF